MKPLADADQTIDQPLGEVTARNIDWAAAIPFFLVHVLAVAGVALLGWSWSGLALAVVFYFVRMFGVTAGYHRYFSHRAFKTSRAFQFFLALLAQSSAQKGVIWWASHHRIHHAHSDQPGDVHSVKLDGFWWSHVGWILSHRYQETETKRVPDLMRYPELRWLNRFYLVPPIFLGAALFLLGSWWALLWGMFVSTVLLWHGTFTINSLAHMMGRRRYATVDNSRNSLLLAVITLGEGWHNNHHYYQRATNNGFFWWEIDGTYYVLRLLGRFGIVWKIHPAPRSIRQANRLLPSSDESFSAPAAE